MLNMDEKFQNNIFIDFSKFYWNLQKVFSEIAGTPACLMVAGVVTFFFSFLLSNKHGYKQ